MRGFHRGQEANQTSTHRPDICMQSVPCLPQLKNILAKRDGSIYVLGLKEILDLFWILYYIAWCIFLSPKQIILQAATLPRRWTMKTIFTLLTVLVMMFGLMFSANAALIDRGGGLIYDDDLNITWLADANYAMTSGYHADGSMTWDEAVNWANNLVYYDPVRDVYWDDWGLPTALNQDGSGPCRWDNCTGSEMGHLFYEELGGTYGPSILTSTDPDLELFSNIQANGLVYYWTSTEWSESASWFFSFYYGGTSPALNTLKFYAWAVRDGDVALGPKEITIDIKPGSDPNSINLSSAGVIPVAILSSDTFDATTVDPETVSLAGASVKVVGKSGKFLCSKEDVNGDGWLDLVCKILTVDFIIEVGQSIAVLEAETFDGTPVRGEDSIRIVPDN